MSETASALRVFVRGKVQGVGYRLFVERRARALGVVGFVRNLSDGRTVEVVAEGARIALTALLADLQVGPPLALVNGVEPQWLATPIGYQEFEVSP